MPSPPPVIGSHKSPSMDGLFVIGDLALDRRRLLLGQAVDVAATQKQLTAWNHDDFVVREDLGQDRSGLGISGVIEARGDDAAIDDQEVDIGAGQTHGRVTLLAASHMVDACALLLSGVQRARIGILCTTNSRPLASRLFFNTSYAAWQRA